MGKVIFVGTVAVAAVAVAAPGRRNRHGKEIVRICERSFFGVEIVAAVDSGEHCGTLVGSILVLAALTCCGIAVVVVAAAAVGDSRFLSVLGQAPFCLYK